MGYTHYWRQSRDLTTEEWERIRVDVELLLAAKPKHSTSAGGHHSDDPLELAEVEVNEERVWFNGAGELGHETFVLTRAMGDYRPRDGRSFDFCKTARKPYDLIVCAVLLVLNDHAEEAVEVSSDGDPSDWVPAQEWASKVLGRPLPLPVEVLGPEGRHLRLGAVLAQR